MLIEYVLYLKGSQVEILIYFAALYGISSWSTGRQSIQNENILNETSKYFKSIIYLKKESCWSYCTRSEIMVDIDQIGL